ncbi:NAD-binding protein [Streptomyces sp. MUM 178J]|uniref:NAD-binding protein n=1 Tax=Streptomyces sp. MUM 178J TaxID=2791991 RepID=UPI001F04D535|nr:NAD-binding protein [Streptomyces sp. MUM 178J]WRQ81745.1 NAD-binding protein [Streptomyces sp. MUM 178J]
MLVPEPPVPEPWGADPRAAGPGDDPPSGRLLLVGDDELTAAVADYATAWGARVGRLSAPSADALGAALEPDVDVVVVVSREDIQALRYALLVEHARPGIRLLVTLFDRTVAGEVVRSVPNCTVIGMTDALVPALLGPCVADRLVTLCRTPDGNRLGVASAPDGAPDGTLDCAPGGAEEGEEGADGIPDGLRVESSPEVRIGAVRRLWHRVHAQVRPLDGSTNALLVGLAGLVLVFLLDTVLGALVLGEPLVAAAWHSAMVLTTVDAGGADGHAPTWYLMLSTVSLLCVLGFSALFTAGLVDRMTSGRLTGLVGARVVPRRGHVIVVGLGQVGLRLCLELQRLGIGVVAVERDPRAACVPVAKSLGIPVMFGRAGDRFLLRKLALPRARAIVAAASDVLENIAVAVAARAVAPDQRIVLRAGGDEDVTSESRYLFRIGTVCDTHRVGGSYIAAMAMGLAPLATFAVDARIYVLHSDGRVHEAARCARMCTPGPLAPSAAVAAPAVAD